ncbi:hypothetical protein MSKOL_1173 [Methanosarcina sp. Kolksee]|uniref:hypothetical protein n=1 Tax=Methanosarcina sp. Kolksee TaxID=1434099 RepID=UPI000615C9F4|nr:hypothetical protein [Methanosarcina sp. Kolksee]AKB46950.1 hypothetical protein MSKOL_1173 [Methanosarcina sp. Kolksee]
MDNINSRILYYYAALTNNSTEYSQTRDIILFDVQIILFLVQILTLICLVVYVIKTWEMTSATRDTAKTSEDTLKEMKEAREQENAPYIIVYCEVPIPYDTMIYLIVKNIGKSIAEDVKIKFTPDLSSSVEYTNDFNINDATFIKEGIKSMHPEYVIKTVLGNSVEYFKKGLPLKYEVEISYVNSTTKREIKTSQIIDLYAIKQLNYTKKFDLNDLVIEVKNLAEEIKIYNDNKK